MPDNGEQKGVLSIGWAEEDITPDGPVSLRGQYYERISKYIQSPLKVVACAMESLNDAGRKEQAVMVSMDLVMPVKAIQRKLRDDVAVLIPDFDTRKLFLNATHIHTGPDPAIKNSYRDMLLQQLSKAVVSAWKRRSAGGLSRALGYAVTGHNRRTRYADGTAEMYGATDRPDFIGMEGPADTSVNMLFCWNSQRELTGIIMNVPCPAQVAEAKYFVSSDYWGEVRKRMAKEFKGKKVYILAQCSAAGDLSPRDLTRGYKTAEPNMWDISGMEVLGKRLVHAVMDAYPQAKEEIQEEIEFAHAIKNIRIPKRKVSDEEYKEALKVSREIHAKEPEDPQSPDTVWNRFIKEVKENEKSKKHGPWDNKKSDYGIVRKKDIAIEQYRDHKRNPYCYMELHVIRLGEVAIATNAFELFVAYGSQIIGRSAAKQTFLVQLCCDYIDYLPTAFAIQGGGYSALANVVGPKGGKILVEETLKMINQMWE